MSYCRLTLQWILFKKYGFIPNDVYDNIIVYFGFHFVHYLNVLLFNAPV